MHGNFRNAALVIAVLMSSPVGPAQAMTTTGTIDAGAPPPWIAVTEPRQAAFQPLDAALLPPQFERVLMLDLDGRSHRSADTLVDMLFAGGPAGGGDPIEPASPAVHPERLAAFALLLIAGGLAGRRLRRRRRLARIAGLA